MTARSSGTPQVIVHLVERAGDVARAGEDGQTTDGIHVLGGTPGLDVARDPVDAAPCYSSAPVCSSTPDALRARGALTPARTRVDRTPCAPHPAGRVVRSQPPTTAKTGGYTAANVVQTPCRPFL
jgi:hypothetical protein